MKKLFLICSIILTCNFLYSADQNATENNCPASSSETPDSRTNNKGKGKGKQREKIALDFFDLNVTSQIIIELKKQNRIISDVKVEDTLSNLNQQLKPDDLHKLIEILLETSQHRPHHITQQTIETALQLIVHNQEQPVQEFNPENLHAKLPSRSIWHTHIKPGIGCFSTFAVAAFLITAFK